MTSEEKTVSKGDESPVNCHTATHVKTESAANQEKAVKFSPTKTVSTAVKMYLLPSNLPVNEKTEKPSVQDELDNCHYKATPHVDGVFWRFIRTVLPYILIGFFAGVALHFILVWNSSGDRESGRHIPVLSSPSPAAAVGALRAGPPKPAESAGGDAASTSDHPGDALPQHAYKIKVHEPAASAPFTLSDMLEHLGQIPSTFNHDNADISAGGLTKDHNNNNEVKPSFSRANLFMGIPGRDNMSVMKPVVRNNENIPDIIDQMIKDVMFQSSAGLLRPKLPQPQEQFEPVERQKTPLLIRRIVRIIPDLSAAQANIQITQSSASGRNPFENIIRQIFDVDNAMTPSVKSMPLRMHRQQSAMEAMLPFASHSSLAPVVAPPVTLPMGAVRSPNSRITVLRYGPFEAGSIRQHRQKEPEPFVQNELQDIESVMHNLLHQPQAFNERKRLFFADNNGVEDMFPAESPQNNIFHQLPVMNGGEVSLFTPGLSPETHQMPNDINKAENLRDQRPPVGGVQQILASLQSRHRHGSQGWNSLQRELGAAHVMPPVFNQLVNPMTSANQAPGQPQQHGGDNIDPWQLQNSQTDHYHHDYEQQQQNVQSERVSSEAVMHARPPGFMPTNWEYLHQPTPTTPVGDNHEENTQEQNQEQLFPRILSPIEMFRLNRLLPVPDAPRANSHADLSAPVLDQVEMGAEQAECDHSTWQTPDHLEMTHREMPQRLVNKFEFADTSQGGGYDEETYDDSENAPSSHMTAPVFSVMGKIMNEQDEIQVPLYEHHAGNMEMEYAESPQDLQQQHSEQHSDKEQMQAGRHNAEDTVVLQMRAEHEPQQHNHPAQHDMSRAHQFAHDNDNIERSVAPVVDQTEYQSDQDATIPAQLVDVDTELEAVE